MLPKKNECCGCEACVNECKFQAIKMEMNNSLFRYPTIDNDKCKNCNACENVCPILKNKANETKVKKIYAGYNTENEALYKSASGGIGYLLSKFFIEKNAIVYGVTYSNNFREAEYIRIDEIKKLYKIQSSKYIETNKKNVYNDIKKDLLINKDVLFIGLPCEVAALKSFLKKDFKNLYTCALICMGPTSQMVGKEYLEYYEKKEKSTIKSFNVRSKKNGWGPPNHIEIVFENKKKITFPFNETEFGKGFEILSRDACTDCKYKIDNTVADITIGDYWGIDKNDLFYNKNGVSIIIFHNQKFEEIIKDIKCLKLCSISYEQALKNNEMLTKSRHVSVQKEKFSQDINKNGLIYACKKTNGWYKIAIKRMLSSKLKKIIKGVLGR